MAVVAVVAVVVMLAEVVVPVVVVVAAAVVVVMVVLVVVVAGSRSRSRTRTRTRSRSRGGRGVGGRVGGRVGVVDFSLLQLVKAQHELQSLAQKALLPRLESAEVFLSNVEALIIRIGVLGPVYCNYNKEQPKILLVIIEAPTVESGLGIEAVWKSYDKGS